MVVAGFENKSVFVDTAPLIYFIEGHSDYQSTLKELFEAADSGNVTLLSSTITLTEILVQPFKLGKPEIAEQYHRLLLNSEGIELYAISDQIALVAAQLRAEFGFKTPDALQLATAMEHNADYFLTNDKRLKGFAKIPVLTLDDIDKTS